MLKQLLLTTPLYSKNTFLRVFSFYTKNYCTLIIVFSVKLCLFGYYVTYDLSLYYLQYVDTILLRIILYVYKHIFTIDLAKPSKPLF